MKMINDKIVIENEKFSLTLGADCAAESLVLKKGNIECLAAGERVPFFAVTEERPYNNEIKLAHPNKRTTFGANRVRLEDGKLIIGFDLITFEAVVSVTVTPHYMTFELTDFIVKPEDFAGLFMSPPPVYEFRLVQIPVAEREHFGEWLNVMWDDEVAINVLASCPYPRIEAEKRKGFRIMYGESLRDVKLKNVGVSLIVAAKDDLLDDIDALEHDYDLPLGVQSRRSGKLLNHAYYRGYSNYATTLDTHLENAKKGGFKYMLFFYDSIFKETGPYGMSNSFEYRDDLPNGKEDLKKMLDKVRAAGIIPGIHFLHTHIGMNTKYCTPVADHRLNTTRRFTLAKPIGTDDTTIYVEENPEGTVMADKCRVLMFMGELISYESYTTEWPYCFKGCTRGYNNTIVKPHDIGTIGGILDISEFNAVSVYADQRTSLEDEIAEKFADCYDAGFEFIYFDGSEGVHAPFEVNVGLAQWRIYKKLKKKPIFCEGAAKSHFSWHMLSGGNAFDVFPPDIFKAMIVEHPVREIKAMQNDFTRINFGWWWTEDYCGPDHIEYGTSVAAGYDCPGAFLAGKVLFPNHPNREDILEVFRRWEDVREIGFLTPEMKEMLRDTSVEHTMLINEKGEYELVPYAKVDAAAEGSRDVSVFVFERAGKSYAVCWYNVTGDAKLSVPIGNCDAEYVVDIAKEAVPFERKGDSVILPIENKRYLCTSLTLDELKKAVEKSKLV